MFYVAREITSEIGRSIGRLLASNPRARLAVIMIGAVFVLSAGVLSVAILTAPRRTEWGSVVGYVTAATGDRLPGGAKITFLDQDRGAGGSATVGVDGYFEVSGVQGGRYTVSIEPVIPDTGKPLTREDVNQARDRLAPLVPAKHQDVSTSGITAELTLGRNRFDVDLRTVQ